MIALRAGRRAVGEFHADRPDRSAVLGAVINGVIAFPIGGRDDALSGARRWGSR
jgi:hypothetical protein